MKSSDETSSPLDRLRPQPDRNRLTFLRGFLRRPQQVGSVIPSSRFLEQRIVRRAGAATARTVVELGPGTGGTTRALLDVMPEESRLLAVELNPDYLPVIRAIDDPRVVVFEGSAVDIRRALSEHGLPAADLVVSGIPFSTMPEEVARAILREVGEALAPGGRFVAYQFRDRVLTLGREILGPAEIELELLNVPPMRVYRWDKNGEGREASG